MKNFKRSGLFLLLLFMLTLSGCNYNYKELFTSQKPEEKLIRVEVHFSDTDKMVGYVKNLGMEENARIFVGGSSVNYLYDKAGNIIASFNYQRIEYIKIIPEE
ncbi:MAG TPA: hypothetical protein VN426_02775 [Syntrophomonadaceae bacterium]|nr:hypothetical protein [Syntrophomonadaceae bacterium]